MKRDSLNQDTLAMDALFEFERVSLERLRLAAEVILAEADAIPAPLEAELVLFKERVECALLVPDKPAGRLIDLRRLFTVGAVKSLRESRSLRGNAGEFGSAELLQVDV
jgi:hypothetical protein